ncbi:MAG: xylann 1,4-beta-xylosidase [Eubacteriales bacterium]
MDVRTIDVKQEGTAFQHVWSKCISGGRANEGLRKDWQDQLQMAVDECGFEYIRFHGLLCDDMGVYHRQNGKEWYCFTYIDQLFDRLLEIGIRPVVEFGFTPDDMARGDERQFWWKGNVSLPENMQLWEALVEALVNHWIERYGKEEVLKWYFEVWNEPNLRPFFHGTKSEYFELYKTTVNAIKKINENLPVGGPATSNFVPDERFAGEIEDVSCHATHKVEDIDTLEWKGVWIEDFLAYCEAEKLPVDFVSTHPYPTDFALDGHGDSLEGAEMKGRSRHATSTCEDLTWLNNALEKSIYAGAEIILTEWSSSPTSRDYSHDYLPVASYIVKNNVECIGLTDALSYWVFTDIFEEAGPGPELFHGGFGLLNMKGMKKPAYHAYRMLHTLGNQLIEKNDNMIMTKDENGKLCGLIWHYPEECVQAVPISEYPDYTKAEQIQALGSNKNIVCRYSGFQPNEVVNLEILDKTHGNVTTCWKEMSYPKNPTRKQEEALHMYANGFKYEKVMADENGQLELELSIEPWTVIRVYTD